MKQLLRSHRLSALTAFSLFALKAWLAWIALAVADAIMTRGAGHELFGDLKFSGGQALTILGIGLLIGWGFGWADRRRHKEA